MSIELLYKIFLQFQSIVTDTRKLKTGDIYFALKGENFNGNHFAKKAVDDGAVFSVIDEAEFEIPGKTILVDDVLTTLQQLAKHHRQQFETNPTGNPIPFLAITGSNGKTTTKELIHAVLSTTFKTYTTEGNLNNHIGIPLTILKIKDDAEMVIIEMGANHLNEIENYCSYTIPTYGLITNCGKAHLEGFGGEENVKKGKGELFDFLRTHSGAAFIMQDYDYLRSMSAGITPVITYGTRNAQIEGAIVKASPFLEVKITNGLELDPIQTQLVGEYNLPNVLAAVAVGHHFGVAAEKIKAALESYAPSNSRSQLIENGSNKIILDAYNANPSSMKLAIENFAKLDVENKVLILGGMAELGNESIAEHEAIINLINSFAWKDVALVGGNFLKIKHPYHTFATAAEAKEWFQQQQFENTHLLIKGSRSIALEKILAS